MKVAVPPVALGMDRHFCHSYANAFAVSNSDSYPKPKPHADGSCDQPRVGDCHRQSSAHHYRQYLRRLQLQPLAPTTTPVSPSRARLETYQSHSARDAASTSRPNSGRLDVGRGGTRVWRGEARKQGPRVAVANRGLFVGYLKTLIGVGFGSTVRGYVQQGEGKIGAEQDVAVSCESLETWQRRWTR